MQDTLAIQPIQMTESRWARLLAMRHGAPKTDAERAGEEDPALALYGPIAGAQAAFVVAQVGQSLDGRVATPAGDARDVSGPDGLAHLHRCRALVDAVIVGENTVTCDNPRLSVRLVEGPDPVRVVIDCHARLTGEEGLFHDGGAPVLVIQSADAPARTLPNAEIIALTPTDGGLAPGEIIAALGARRLHRILVEGGARTIARFVEAGRVDHLHVALSPIIIGSGPSGINLSPIERLAEAHRPAAKVYSLGSDILFDCPMR